MHPTQISESDKLLDQQFGHVARLHPDHIVIARPRSSYVVSEKSLQNLQVEKHEAALSDQSKREIKRSVMSLHALSLPRKAKISADKIINAFRCTFITLKLPAAQKHSDVEIKEALNLFLNNLRISWHLENYVWVSELQKNENIHFHMVIDKFIPWAALTRYWNLAIDKLGYVEDYAAKFREMDEFEYIGYRIAQDKKYKNDIKISSYKTAYAAGTKNDWRSPNSVDVKSVKSTKVAYYVSKYIAKGDKSNVDLERAKAFGKMWARSQSLSRLKYDREYTIESTHKLIADIVKHKTTRDYQFDYCRVIYFKIDALPYKLRQILTTELVDNATDYDYPFPT